MICLLLTGDGRNPLGKVLPMDDHIGVGFGDAIVYRDGECFFDGEQYCRDTGDDFNYKQVAEIELIASQEPERHWVIWYSAMLWSAAYVRTGYLLWQCVYAGMGFADDENSEKDREAIEQILQQRTTIAPDPALRLSDRLPSLPLLKGA